MGWSFRESIKILPGVRLNFSRKGVSASLGTKGLHLGVGGGRAPRVTGGVGPLRYYRSLGGDKPRSSRSAEPSRVRVLAGATLAIGLLGVLLWLPPHWLTQHLQAAAPQVFPASWAAGSRPGPVSTAPEDAPPRPTGAAPGEPRRAKGEPGKRAASARREPGH